MAADIFDNTILCKKCSSKMQKGQAVKNGFVFRIMVCPKCGEKLVHPVDEQEYERYITLKNKEFRVKMRLVGNSYAVSIPKEIVSFMNEQKKMMDEMVKLCFEDFGRLSLNFEDFKNKNLNARVIKAKEYKVVKDNKPVLHVKQFADSANPSHNKTFLIKKKNKED